MKVTLVTCEQTKAGTKDDQIFFRHLQDLNHSVDFAVWSDPAYEWQTCDLVIVRSTWDYHRKLQSFLDWCERTSKQTTMVNSAETIVWNSAKEYLFELQQKGISTVSTFLLKDREAGIAKIQKQLQCGPCVVKPTVSATADLTFKIETADQISACVDKILERGPLILQPFVESVVDDGEVSLIFFKLGEEFEFSHAIQKRAKKNDFRVQSDFGGTVSSFEPSQKLIDFSLDAISRVPRDFNFVRVDVLNWRINPQLGELELIEPALFFESSDRAADLFTQSLQQSGHLTPAS